MYAQRRAATALRRAGRWLVTTGVAGEDQHETRRQCSVRLVLMSPCLVACLLLPPSSVFLLIYGMTEGIPRYGVISSTAFCYTMCCELIANLYCLR